MILGLHGFTETGDRFREYSGIEVLGKELGHNVVCPNAPLRNWTWSNIQWLASYKPDIVMGYSDGAWMTALLVAHGFVDKGVVYGGFYYGQCYRFPGKVIFARGCDDATFSRRAMKRMSIRFQAMGRETQCYSLVGNHLDRWNRQLNPYIIEAFR